MLATPELILEAAQPARLEEVLRRVSRTVPLYARHAVSDADPPGRVRQFPLITKQDIRNSFPANFLGDAAALDDLLIREQVELEHTSGTSDERTRLILPKGWWGEQEARAFQLNAFISATLRKEPQARRLSIASPACNGDISFAGTPSCEDRVVGNALFVALSKLPFLWGPRDLERMVREACEWDPVFLDVDPVYGVVFARYCEQQGIQFPRLKFVLCSYEYLSTVHRRVLERAFKVPVFNLYGSTETGHLLMESAGGVLRPSLETAALEVLKTDHRGVGDLVVTTLTNPFMPLLRYRIGDLVSASPHPYGTTYELHGRTADVFLLPSGKRVTVKDVDECFERTAGIAHYQLRQKDQTFHLKYIRDVSAGEPSIMGLTERLRQLLGTASVQVEAADLLMPQGSGKFRLCVPESSG